MSPNLGVSAFGPMRSKTLLFSLILTLQLTYISGYYLPGVAPKKFHEGDEMSVLVTTMTSNKYHLSYDYYSLPFCEPEHKEALAESLGEVLAGDRTEKSLYKLKMNVDESCKVVCRKTYSPDDMDLFLYRALDEYRINMVLDNLPLAEIRQQPKIGDMLNEETHYQLGYPLARDGDVENSDNKAFYINNHINFTILYHPVQSSRLEDAGNLIVGFEVHPYSIKHEYEGVWDDACVATGTCNLKTCTASGLELGAQPQVLESTTEEVIWTYSVTWKESDRKWASRWDVYLQMHDDQIHWFSIVNSLVVLVFLTGMVAMIMMRILHKDLARYNEMEPAEADEIRDETGWKLVFADVFRPPGGASMLAVFVGSGVQVTGMFFIVMVFALLGFLSPSNRGALMTAMLLLFVLLGGPAGYYSARFCKLFKISDRKKNTALTALTFPGVVFLSFFIINIFIWSEQSTGAVPFGTIMALTLLWFGISVPLVFMGSYFGFKKEAMENPVRTNSIPRQIPAQVWYMQAIPSIIMGGVLPFGAVFVELFFVLSSIWQHRFYYLFGFLFMVLLILVLTCAEIAVVMCYFHLCSEDYRWWWRAFFTSGSSAFYLFIYCCYYFFTRSRSSHFVAGLTFIGYTFILSYTFFVLTGFIGFMACFVFVRKIYGSVHID